MAIVTRWKTGFGKIFNADAEKVAEEICEIGESFTPQQVVDKARDETTELHKCFEWDDTEAAKKYREDQARHICRMLVIVRTEDDEQSITSEPEQIPIVEAKEFRVFSHIHSEHAYSQTISIMKDEDRHRNLLEQALGELRAFKQKYACLQELANIIDMIDAL